MTTVENFELREVRWPVTASVAVLLASGVNNENLILVRQKNGGGWGLPAGGLHRGETLLQALRREVEEETMIGAAEESVTFEEESHVVVLPADDKTRIGLVFSGHYSGRVLDRDGWEVKGDPDVDFARPFGPYELMQLFDGQGIVYKPEFNLPQILRHIVRFHNGTRSSSARKVDLWLYEKSRQIPGLTYANAPSRGYFEEWLYTPFYVEE